MRVLVASFIVFAAAVVTAQELAIAPPSHVTVATSIATPAPAAGKPISLVVDVTPNPKIHVYAPGAENYQAVTLTVDTQPDLSVQPPRYPKSTLLDTGFEKVPVYDKAFRVTDQITIRAKAGAQTVVVKGKLDYQACDDEVCYKAATIPVSWTIALKR